MSLTKKYDIKHKDKENEKEDNNHLLDHIEIKELTEEEILDLLDEIDYDIKQKTQNTQHNSTSTSTTTTNTNTNTTTPMEGEETTTFCHTCQTADNIVTDNAQGTKLCTGCGDVLGNVLNSNPEWRYYPDDNKADNSRCSFPTNHFLPQSSLGTSIGGHMRNKLKTLHSWGAMPYKERSLHTVLKEIQSRCRKANILKCIEDDAKILYKNISECKHPSGTNKGKNIIIRGDNRKGLIAACVFYACLRKGHTRSPKEIAQTFDLKYTDITKGCKTFVRLIKIRQMDYQVTTSSAEQFVERFCKQLRLKKECIEQAVKISKNIQRLNIASVHTPLSVATGSIHLMIDMNELPISKKQIAKQFCVSEVTIMKTFKKLDKYKHILNDDEQTQRLVKIIEKERSTITMPKALQQRYDDVVNNEVDPFTSSNSFDPLMDSFDDYIDTINADVCEQIETTDAVYNDMIDNMLV